MIALICVKPTYPAVAPILIDWYSSQTYCWLCRGSAQMIALICLKPTYPAVAPIFCINLHWDGEKNTTNTEWVRLVTCPQYKKKNELL
jgi:hypothetical protein